MRAYQQFRQTVLSVFLGLTTFCVGQLPIEAQNTLQRDLLVPANGSATNENHSRTSNPETNKSVPLREFETSEVSGFSSQTVPIGKTQSNELDWLAQTKVGYDGGFVVGIQDQKDLKIGDFPFQLKINGWGQIRFTNFDSQGTNRNLNQIALKRARLDFSGSAFTRDLQYFLQLDGRTSSGDDVRLLDYYMHYDLGHHALGCAPNVIGFKTGKYKIPFSFARSLSGRDLEFADRSMASIYFDINRSLGGGLYGKSHLWRIPMSWEVAIFNGFLSGGASTGSSGMLDNNFAYSGRIDAFPSGEWGSGSGELADFDWHEALATRIGAGFASSNINRLGSSEFDSSRVVDSGLQLGPLLPAAVSQYDVTQYAVDGSIKYRGWSTTLEYYIRNINGFQGATIPDLYDHGFWLQTGKFVVPDKLQLLARWSRIVGDSGTLGVMRQSSDEIGGGFVWYIRRQHAKFTFDATYLNGASVNSSALNISAGDIGWLYRFQFQFAF